MLFNTQNESWDVQWRMDNTFKPKRTIFVKSLPAQLSNEKPVFLPYHRPDLKAPLFETISEVVARIKLETNPKKDMSFGANKGFMSSAAKIVEERICITVGEDESRMGDVLGYVPSFKCLLELWTNPAQLAKADYIASKPIPESSKVVTNLLSTLIFFSNQQLIDTLRRMYGHSTSSMTHPSVQRLMKIFTNVAGPTDIIDFDAVSENTQKVCRNLVGVLCDTIKGKIERDDIAVTLALADRIEAKISLGKKCDSNTTILDRALLFHPETFVSIGQIRTLNFEDIRKRSFYVGVNKFERDLEVLLNFREALTKRELKSSSINEIIPSDSDSFYAYLPGKIPSRFAGKLCKGVIGPSFYVNSEECFSVCPIPLNSPAVDSSKYVIVVTFNASGSVVMVKIDDSLVIRIDKSRSTVKFVDSDKSEKEYPNVKECDKCRVDICCGISTIVANGKSYRKCFDKPPMHLFFAGKDMNISNVCIKYEIMCKFGNKCNKLNDPEHMKSFYHIKSD